MAFIKTDMFYLIRFRQRPNCSENEYACVPNSWIVSRADRKVRVAYPKEDSEETKRRAEAKETPGKDWNVIEAEIDYQSVTFVNADRWSTMEKVDRPTGEDEIIIVADEDSTDTADEEIAETPNMTSIKKESSMHTGGKLVPNPLATFRDPAAEKKTSNSLNNTHTESIKKEVTNKEKEVNEALPTHNNPSAQEIVGKTTIKEDVEKLSSFLKKAKKFIAESNQRHQSKQQQHIAEVSEDVLRYSRNKAPLSESIETNSTQMKPATQTLLNLAKQSQQSQIIKENTLKITGQPPHRKLREIPDVPAEVNCIQKSNLPKVTKDTASVPNRINSANVPHALLHQQNRQLSPAHYDHLPKKGRNKVVRTSSTGPRVIGGKEPRQTVLRNAVPAEQNVSNPVNQLAQTYKQTYEDQSQQAYDVFIQTNSNVNKIIITNSKAATNGQRIPSIKSKNAIDAEQNFVNQANRLSELYKHWEQQLPLASREHLAQNVSADNVLVKTTTTGNPFNQHNVSQNNTISKVQNFPSMDQLPKASNQYLKPAVMQNERHVAHTRCVSLAGESAAANSLNQRPGFRDTRQNIPTALANPQMNQPYQISKNSHENQTRPVIKAYLLQDPRTKLLFLKAATRVNDDERKPPVQCTTKKVPPALQTVPSANQSNQPFNQSYKNQFAVDSRDAELQNLRAQQIFQRRPNTMHGTSQNGYPQNSTQNIPITVNPSYSATHQPCPCLCSHGRPVTSVTAKDPMAKQDPHVQISLISKSTAGNSGEQRVYPETDTDNRFSKETQENKISVPQSSCPQSSTRNKPAAHCSKDLANQQVELSMAEQNSPINVVSSDKVIFTEKAPVNKIISSKSPIESSLQTKATAIALKDKLHNTLHDYTLLFSQMNSNISGTLEACNDMQSTITEYNKSFKNIIGKVTDLCQLKIDQIHSIKSKKVEKPQNKLKRRKVMKDDDGDYLDEHQGNENNKSSKTNEECKKPLKKKRKQAKVQKEVNSFVLPPEYDPANSRWTLKHQKAAPGLVEVIPRGRVYIDAINFKYCKRTAKDCRTLARMLLTEIFSENALRVCSLTGARAKAFSDQDVRPGLDEQARIIMLTFVEDYGRKHDWVVCDTQSVINSVRSKLQEIRNRAN